MPQQLSLPVQLNDDATFANFFTDFVVQSSVDDSGDSHTSSIVSPTPNFTTPNQAIGIALAVNSLRLIVDGHGDMVTYLWGSRGSGVSHLLQAACHEGASSGASVQYLPLSDVRQFSPDELLQGLESLSLLCIDDVQLIAGNTQWEQALFHLFNRLREMGGRLLVGANQPVRTLSITLDDLRSRLSWGVALYLPTADDEGLQQIIQFRAKQRGITLDDAVAKFLLSRAVRDTHGVMACLDQLEVASLQEKRKLTIPFLKSFFGW